MRQLLPTLGLRTWTVDVDGVVVSTGLQVERGGAGLQPAPAEGAQLLPDHGAPGRDDPHPAGQESVGQRPRWEGGPAVLAGPVAAAGRAAHGAGPGCGFAWMGRFSRQDVLRWLQGRGVGYAIKVPFYRWLDLQRYIRNSPTWVPVAPGVTGFAVPGAETPWHIPVTVTIYRKKVHHRATKNYQLDLFDPNDGHYEYSAVTSNLALTVRNLWYFACGRGNHEKTIAQLKTGLAFHSVPTQTYAANSAWQAARGARPQPVDELPTRDGRPAAAPHPEAHRRAPAAEPCRRSASNCFIGPPCWSAPVARRGCG